MSTWLVLMKNVRQDGDALKLDWPMIDVNRQHTCQREKEEMHFDVSAMSSKKDKDMNSQRISQLIYGNLALLHRSLLLLLQMNTDTRQLNQRKKQKEKHASWDEQLNWMSGKRIYGCCCCCCCWRHCATSITLTWPCHLSCKQTEVHAVIMNWSLLIAFNCLHNSTVSNIKADSWLLRWKEKSNPFFFILSSSSFCWLFLGNQTSNKLRYINCQKAKKN